jgi:three-Cys-motif partner protein
VGERNMPHKAGEEFFKEKKPWSERKDLVLTYYLKPYLAKVARLGKPILIVDGFAGPGLFDDGKPGSPVLICEKAQEAIARGVNVQVLCVESDSEDLFPRLKQNLSRFPFARTVNKQFLTVIPEIEAAAAHATVFLYLDPFTVEGIEWAALDRIFEHLSTSRSSIEVLLNLNVPSFVRRALAALKLDVGIPSEESDGDEEDTPIDKLNSIAGGDWWIPILKSQNDYSKAVKEITNSFCKRLASRFREVCEHSVKEKIGHTIPKYILVFGSRHEHARLLMNEAMVTSRKAFAESSLPNEPTLFETRPFEVVPDERKLPEIVLMNSENKLAREKLVLAVIRAAFCDYSEAEIKQCIKSLVGTKKLTCSSGTEKINDQSIIWRS